MTSPEGPSTELYERDERAVLFIDIVDSVRLTEIAGEEFLARWLGFVDYVIRQILPQHDGNYVKSSGDGMLLDFKTAPEAAAAALAIQAHSKKENLGVAENRQILLRMAIEYGEVLIDERDMYGCSVNLAARVMDVLTGPGEIFTSANTRDQLIDTVDGAIVDCGECYLKSMDKPVRVYRIGPPGPKPILKSAPVSGHILPAIAIIPFQSRAASPQHKAIGEILADDLIRGFSRSPYIDVISRLSTTALSGRDISVVDIGDHLEANYVLSGIYRTHGQSIQLDLELAEVKSQRIVWSERHKEKISAIFEEDLDLIHDVVSEVLRAILSREIRRVHSAPLPTLESSSLLLSAITLMHRNSISDFKDSKKQLEIVLARAPRQAISNAWFANWYVLRVQQGWADDPQKDGKLALEYSKRAVDADPECSLALALDGFVHTNLLKRLDTGIVRYDQAVSANPNDALAWLLRGTLHAFKGDGKTAIHNTQRALRLTPLDPHKYFYDSLSATACLAAHQYEQALQFAETSLLSNCTHTSTLRAKAVALWYLDRHSEARDTIKKLLAIEPGLTISGWQSRSPSAPFEIGLQWSKIFKELGVPE